MHGTVTLSMVIELGWGTHDLRKESPLSAERVKETETLSKLLTACDELGLPMSFCVVGHLLHRGCDGVHEGPHPGDWFARDPGTDVDTDPLYYAPDLVTAIKDSVTPHEIGTHTYSHALPEEISAGVLDWELQQVRIACDEIGIEPPVSFVPPRHQSLRQTQKEVLRSHGIKVVRKPFRYGGPPNGRLARYKWNLSRRHPVGTPKVVDGLLETYCAPYPALSATHLPDGRRPPNTVFRPLPSRLRQRLHTRFLENAVSDAIERDSYVHIRTHLFNLSNDQQWQPTLDFLEYLSRKRESGMVSVKKMEDLAEEFLEEGDG